MDQERERIHADLRGLVSGDVRCDDAFLQLYATDASIYEIRPLGVVRPKSVEDVRACVQYAAENGISIHSRGAGTGLAGESLGPGLILDFSYYMRRWEWSDEETIRVQPGVVHGPLNRKLALRGRTFGPDPATGTVSTMGGVVSLDGSGSHWLRYGSARDHVESFECVLANGEVVQLGKHDVAAASANPEATVQQLVGKLAALLREHESMINQHRPATLVNRSGYHLYDLLDQDQLNLAKLIVGSEGTLAVITDMTVKTSILPKSCGVALLFFDRLESAARGALEVTQLSPSACDLMDRRLLTIAKETDPQYDKLIPAQAEAMLLIEQQGETPQEVRDSLQSMIHRVQRRKRLAFDARLALEPDEVQLFWQLASHVVPRLYRLKGSTRPLPFVEDIAIPPAKLAAFLGQLQNILKAHHVTASLFAHAGHGQLHIRPFMDLADPRSKETMRELSQALYEEVQKVGGTVSGEHGDGLSRTWYLPRIFGPLHDVFRQVKNLFDPLQTLNPGKIVAQLPQAVDENLRAVVADPVPSEAPESTAAAGLPIIQPLLTWSVEEMTYAARSCNGCGRCRTQMNDERMCPVFRYLPGEEATPRAKANLMRALLTRRLDPEWIAHDDVREIADLCVNCHQCRLECPASVDIPQLMMECKSQHVATNGLRFSDWFFARLDRVASWGAHSPGVTNRLLRNRRARWLMEKLFGIAQGRKLPQLARQPYLRLAPRLKLNRPTRHSGRKVLFFVDVYANWFDVQLAEALVRVLERNHASVYVPTRQYQSGMAALTMGAIEQARMLAQKNVSLLADAVRQGYHIVCTEPSAALALTHEYPKLMDTEDSRLVAQHTSEACGYLWRMHQLGQLELDLKPINATIGYHEPCHLRALESHSPGWQLLGLIPGLTVQRIEQGCSGMAGTYGLRKENYRSSLRSGWNLISYIRDHDVQVCATECSACKIQMEQGTPKPTLHPLKLLALSYRLMPEVAQQLHQPGEELVVS